MNIYDALQHVPLKKRMYFLWKHDLEFDKTRQKKTEQQFLKSVEAKTMNPYIKWENSNEYQALLSILMKMKVIHDIEKVYKTVSDKAKEGDSKAIDTLLKIKKEIDQSAQVAEDLFRQPKDSKDKNEDDGLTI
ncbi:hypothetical protein [Salibacterium qingdaonense]|uniref:Uncharacterized protein n=1 Tax=Salibacterium qingdaonense TaxID=266892 RepID=A0A1I4QMK6_9BACI|nr:hypothetical protein [Salibacterium qingdaonense]SFM41271.1 hypothetical protein SAMN04488054_14515 [Salibacterium qingdaonense]